MKNRKLSTTIFVVLMTLLLSMAGGLSFANEGNQMKPDLAAKKEMVRKQQAKRITPQQRKAAAETLKAERLRVYKAKQAVKNATPLSNDSNQPTTQQ